MIKINTKHNNIVQALYLMAMRAKMEGMSLNAYMIEALSAYTYALDQKHKVPMNINLQVHE